MYRSGLPVVSVLCLAALILPTACDDDTTGVRNTDFFAAEPVSYEVPHESQTTFRLEGINGTVEVSGIPETSTITIGGERRVESDSVEDAEDHLDSLEVEVRDSETEVVVRTQQPSDSAGRNYIVDYTISLPADLTVEVTHINGVVAARDINSTVTIANVNGVIVADDLEGSTEATLVNGNIVSSVTLPLEGQIELQVVNGNVTLDIPEDTSAQFSARVVNGRVTVSNLTLTDEIRTAVSVTGTLGGGNGDITLRSTNGNIVARGL